MIDFTPGDPYGKISIIVMIWIASGLVGLLTFGWLLNKYRIDRNVATRTAAKPRVRISERGMESAVFALIIDLLVVGIGAQSAVMEWQTINPLPPANSFAIWGLIAIPWLLELNGLREFFHQRYLLGVGTPSTAATRLFTEQDVAP